MEFENVKARERDDDGNTVDNIDHFDEYGFAVFKLGSKYSACDDRIHVFRYLHTDKSLTCLSSTAFKTVTLCRRDKTPVGVHKEWEKLFSKWMYYKNGTGIKVSMFKIDK